MSPRTAPWWQGAVVYQIYPRSFQDTSGNGVGDLPGITRRLPYLAETLGVDTVWVSPFYPSPMADFGYDVSDYTGVDPLFGTLADADAMIEETHRLGMRIIIDWVPNHTSNQHPWFTQSRSSLTHPKRDWYVWRDPSPEGGEPNNWLAVFGGKAWTLDEQTGQYYLHSFLPEQPDLNWRNPEVVDAMMDTLRFWLDRGVDGFRVDVAHFMMKDPELRDEPARTGEFADIKFHAEYDELVHVYSKGHPDVLDVHRRIRATVDEYEDRFVVGEIHEADWDRWASYYGENLDALHMPFNFSLLWSPWTARDFRERILGLENALPEGAWGNHVLGNHDEPRLVTRFGPHRARAAAVLLLTLRGTPTIYYADELGIGDAHVPEGAEQDPWGKAHPEHNRDGCRSPMQWTIGPGMGFTDPGTAPWLPFSDPTTSVDTQIDDPTSMLSLYRALLALRRDRPELSKGSLTMLDDTSDTVLAYRRDCEGSTVYVAVNFTDAPQNVTFPESTVQLLGTRDDRSGPHRSMTLQPNEAVVATPV